VEHFNYILILLGCAVIFTVICHRLRIPPIVGYLCVGILVGPGGLRWLPSIEDLQPLAEFGVVFLMFALGLEFSIPKLIAARKTLFGVGGMQVLLCTLAGSIAGLSFGVNVNMLLIVSCALALSSTAVVVKQLTEQKEQHSEYGNLAINVLLFQDIAAVFLLVLIPALSGYSTDTVYVTFVTALVKGAVVVIGLALTGLWILRPLFHIVTKVHSTELFMLATLLTALSAAGITHYFGLSMALGAFLAGLMLGETEFKHQIELDIRAFRDVLLGLFFVVIGAYLELDKILQHIGVVTIILAFIIISKTGIIYLVARVFGKARKKDSLRLGIILAHGGEFSFVVLKEAIDNNIISAEYRPIIFSAVVISLLIAPLMIRFNRQLARLIFSAPRPDEHVELHSNNLAEHALAQKEHVILCGFGRAGQILARFLDQEHIPWLALDLDPMRISKSSVAGELSFYGDATQPQTLAAAGLSRARMVVITFGYETSALAVLQHVRAMRLDVPVFVRTRDDTNLEIFQKAGATEVVPESLEGSIMLASHLLLTLGVPTKRVIAKVRRIHADHYANLRGFYAGTDDLKTLEDTDISRRSLHTIVLPDGAAIIGQSLAVLITPESGATIQALTRGIMRINEPDLDTVLQTGDVIVILATPEEAFLIEEKTLTG